MTSRVQKGAAIFRPAKAARPTTSARPSVAPESNIQSTSHVINFELEPQSESPNPSSELPPPLTQPRLPPLVLASASPSPAPSAPPSRQVSPPPQIADPPEIPKKRKPPEPESELTIIPEDGGGAKKRRKSSDDSSPVPPKSRLRKTKQPKNDDSYQSDNEHSASEEDTSPPAHKKSSKKKRRVKKSPPPPFDPDADPGEELDPTTVTMASLCEDTGQGRISSKAAEISGNWATWKAQAKVKRAEQRTKLERKKYGIPLDEETIRTGAMKMIEELTPALQTNNAPPESGIINGDPDAFDYTQEMVPDRLVAKVRIGPNGQTILDPDSLVVERDEPEPSTEGYTHVVETDTSKFTNSGSYTKRFRGSRWSVEETELFYNALSQYGENYELISYVLPGRDRKACRNKFKVEDKKNHARINHCLQNRVPIDMETLSRMTGKDFSGPVPEIKVPEPVPRPTVNDSDRTPTPPPEEASTSTSKTKKRKRRASAAADEGVIIVGNIDDTFDINNDM